MLKPDRDINKLDKDFKKKVKLFMKEVEPMGVFITEAWRTNQRQAYLRLRGLSRVRTSYHQKGLAIDIGFQDDTRTEQIERELYPKDMKRWREVAKIANKYGIDWGYDLWNWDKCHMQDNGTPLSEDDCPKWAKKGREWVIRQGISNGSRPNELVTRAEIFTMLYNTFNKESEE